MDRPSLSGTPTSSGSPTSGAPPGAAREPVRSVRGARATPAPQRWARRLLWLILALAIGVGVGSRVFDSLRSPLAHTEVVPSVLYDRYGTPIAEIGPSVAHASLGLEDMAPALVDAIVAVLDPSFLERDGVDATSYASSLRRVFDEPDAPGDGDGSDDGIMRRYLDTVHDDDPGAVAEARMLLAELRLGRQLSRPEILERFANVVYLGRGAYGVHAAAAVWYGIPASDLTVTQAAYIASLIDAPWGVDATWDRPDDPYRPARLGRDRVLVAMYEHGVLTSDELAAGRSVPVESDVRAAGSDALGAAAGGYVRMLVADAGLVTAVGEAYLRLVERYGTHRVVTAGLHVTTSLDLPAQRAAVATVRDQLGPAAGADVVVLDRSGDVRVLVSVAAAEPANDVDVVSRLRPRPLGDLLGSAASTLGPWIAPDISTEVIAQAADVAQVAAAFSIVATGGEERTSRIVLEAGDAAPSRLLRDRDIDRWLMNRRTVFEAAVVSQLRADMDTLTLPSGVTALGRAGISPETGDAWFAGWTSHYTAAVRITLNSPRDPVDAASRASQLFAAVLDPLQYPPATPGDSG
ncbi:transglycosylase domain-containing protein [Candidatus Poriferisodalis sp.]|uniref:transglycosylase domain-containing protein n=1 Tax=Candidatus Poriferisodalis sp. TaxID=3101277 RepID=UPI003AF8DDF4